MSYEIKLLELPDQPMLAMRSILPVAKLPEFFGKAYGGVMTHLEELGEYPAGMPFASYFNLDMNAMDVEAGFPVAKELEGITGTNVSQEAEVLVGIIRFSRNTEQRRMALARLENLGLVESL